MTYTFRVTQDLVGYYEGSVDIKARSEKEARARLSKMTTNELEELVDNWDMGDEFSGSGDIFIQELKSKE